MNPELLPKQVRSGEVSMAKLTAEHVSQIFQDCLFTEEEVAEHKRPDDAVIVEGVLLRFGLHPARLESHREEVLELLGELPEQFMESKGGGWSFLNACVRGDGTQWGEHSSMEELFVLGIGLGLAGWCLPREMWPLLPGEAPYVWVEG